MRYCCNVLVMKRLTLDIDDELHTKLRIKLFLGGLTVRAFMVGVIADFLGVEVPVAAEKGVKEVKSPINRLKPIPSDGVVNGADWESGMCKKHGRMAVGGRWICCEKS